jgi:acetoacetyl-CoA synthetase
LGRSDATLKPAGVRVATADIYAALAMIPRVTSALAVGYTPSDATSEKIVLFVVLPEGDTLDVTLEAEIKATLRAANAFYVPAIIIQAPAVPRTSNNKLSELTVKRALRGEDAGNLAALANPESVDFFTHEARQKVVATLG